MTALLFCFEKIASVVGIKFVDESENFDFEKSGKSSRPRREKWSMLYIAESDEGDVESTESRDASSFEEDVEISSFEKSLNFDLGFRWIIRPREKSSQVSSQ